MDRIMIRGIGIILATAMVAGAVACGSGGGGGTGSQTWIGPGEFFSYDTDGTWAVWTERKPADIWYDGPGGRVEITSLLDDDTTVLWPNAFDFDGRYLALTAISRSQAHLYYYDTLSGDLVRAADTRMPDSFMPTVPTSIFPVSTVPQPETLRRGPLEQAEPRVHDGIMAWHISDNGFFRDNEVYAFDIPTRTLKQLTDNTEDDRLVNVHGGTVVVERWPTSGGEADIFAVDVSSGVETRLTDNSSVEKYVSFEEGSVVWLDGNTIMGLDLASMGSSPSVIRTVVSTEVWDLWLDGDLLAWRETDFLSDEIWYADLSSGIPSALPLRLMVFPAGPVGTSLRVGGGIVAWISGADGDGEIYAWDTMAVLPTVVRLTDNDFYEGHFDTGEGVIWWTADYDGKGEKLFSCDIRADLYRTLVTEGHQRIPGMLPGVAWSRQSRNLQAWARRLEGGAPVAISNPNLDLASRIVVQGQIAVWTASDGSDREIYYTDLSGSTPVRGRVTNNSGTDDQIQLDGGILAWRSHDGNDGEIYACDLAAPVLSLVQVTDNDWEDGRPRVRNGLIVWEGSPGAGEPEVFYYDLHAPASSVVRLTDDTLYDGVPATDGTIIAWAGESWMESNTEIFSFDISSGSGTILQVTDDPYEDWAPVVDRGVIAWERYLTNMWGEIRSYTFIYDTRSPDPVPTSLFLEGFHSNQSLRRGGPAFEGGILVWQGFEEGLDGNEILGADLSRSTDVFRLSDNVAMDWTPRVGNRAVIWRQEYWLSIHVL